MVTIHALFGVSVNVGISSRTLTPSVFDISVLSLCCADPCARDYRGAILWPHLSWCCAGRCAREQYFDPTCPCAVYILWSSTLTPSVFVLCMSYVDLMDQYFDPTCPGAVQVFVLVSSTLTPPVLVLCTSYGAVL